MLSYFMFFPSKLLWHLHAHIYLYDFFFSINTSVFHLTINYQDRGWFCSPFYPCTEQGLAHTGGTHKHLKDN